MKKYLFIIPLALLVIPIVGCQDKTTMAELEEFTAQTALEAENEALILRQADAFQKHDLEALRIVYSPDLISHSAYGVLSFEEMLKDFEQTLVAFPDFKFSVGDLFVKGNKIGGRYIWTGTHTGDIEGFPASGKAVKVNGVAIFRVENGKIVEEWFGSDRLSLYQQLGFELKPPEVEK